MKKVRVMHGEFELSETQSKEPEIIKEISKWVGRECNSAIMGDGLLVKTKNRIEMVVLKSIQFFGLRYTGFFFFFQTCQAISDYRMVELLIEAKNI